MDKLFSERDMNSPPLACKLNLIQVNVFLINDLCLHDLSRQRGMALKQHEIGPVLHFVLLQTKNRVAENAIHFHEEGKKKIGIVKLCPNREQNKSNKHKIYLNL